MPSYDVAVAIRPGEHACCRFAHAQDRERLTLDFVRDGLRRGHKVVYRCGGEDEDGVVAALAGPDELLESARARGQLAIRPLRQARTPDGRLDVDRMLADLGEEREQATAEGYAGLSVAGDMAWALDDASALERLAEYETRVADHMDPGPVVFLCLYDHGRSGTGTLSDVTAAHDVDVSPELAPLGRDSLLAAARVQGDTLRLAGELDFGCTPGLADVLDAHFHGALCLDLADLRFVDVAGMRTLRGRKGQPMKISATSGAVRRLVVLLGWDTDPGVEVVDAA
jgi:anti-anti-sigma regulatory factor